MFKINCLATFVLLISGSSFALTMNFQNYNSTDTVAVNIIPADINTTKCLNNGTPEVGTPDTTNFSLTGTLSGKNSFNSNIVVQNPSSSYCFSGIVKMAYPSSSSKAKGQYLCMFKYYYDSTNGWNPQVITSNTTPPCSSNVSGDTGKFCIWGNCQ